MGIHLSFSLILCDSRELDLPSGLLGKHFTATSLGRNWNHSDCTSSLISSIFYFLLHSSQCLQICILHPYIHREEYSAQAPQLPSSVARVSFSYTVKHLQLSPRSAALWLLLSKCVQLCFVCPALSYKNKARYLYIPISKDQEVPASTYLSTPGPSSYCPNVGACISSKLIGPFLITLKLNTKRKHIIHLGNNPKVVCYYLFIPF